MAAIIFDFDGTIVDSFDYVTSYLIKAAGLQEWSSGQLQELKGLSMVAIARRVGLPWWRMPGLFFRGRRDMQKVASKLEPIEGMPEVVRKANAEGHELFIISNNNMYTLHKFLHRHKLHTYFLELYGGINLFSKAPALKKLIKDHNLEVKDCVYVGDELRDIEASQSVGVRIIAVTWGFAKTADLKKHNPTALVSTPAELLTKIEEL